MAEREGVEIRYYAIIYDLIDDIKGVLSGMLAPIQRETFLGNAEVLQAFDISKVGKIAGCRVTDGVVRKGARVRIIRSDIVVLELGTLQTLKRFKDEVNEGRGRSGMRDGFSRLPRHQAWGHDRVLHPGVDHPDPLAVGQGRSQRQASTSAKGAVHLHNLGFSPGGRLRPCCHDRLRAEP